MAKLGMLQVSGEADAEMLRGTLDLIHSPLSVRISKDPDATGMDGHPTHEIHMKTPDGRAVSIGVAWRHAIKRGANTGGYSYSLTIDHPELPAIFASAFPHPSGGYLCRTDRPQQGGRAQGEAA